MKIMSGTLFLCQVIFGWTLATGQPPDTDWRHRIFLFQSTRADVEKLFGKPIGSKDGGTHKVKDGILYLDYYGFDHCKSRYGFEADWNLPEWTVTEIEFRPDYELTFAALHLNLKRFRKAHLNPGVPDLVSYVDDQDGVEYTVESDGTLNSVRYFPGSRFDSFRCPKK